MSRWFASLMPSATRILACCSFLVLLAVPVIAQGATLVSDKSDYPPGATAVLTGAGFGAGETMTLQVLHADGSPSNGLAHDAWYVVADVEGAFVTTWRVCEDDCVGALLRATAIGQTSGSEASCLFTDAPCVGAANLDQARNGAQSSVVSPVDMQNGNLGAQQSHYVEGQSVPYRAVLTDLPVGESITLTLGFDIKHSNRHALDYLTHYDRLQPHTYGSHVTKETIDPLIGLVGFPVTFTTFPIPAPTSVNSPVLGQPTASFIALPAAEKLMTLYGGTITAIAYVNQGDLTATQSEARVNVTFTPTNTKAVLAWGGHIGSRAYWGFDGSGTPRSAGGISGSPYHMRLIDWVSVNPPPCLSNLGNQDRSPLGWGGRSSSDVRNHRKYLGLLRDDEQLLGRHGRRVRHVPVVAPQQLLRGFDLGKQYGIFRVGALRHGGQLHGKGGNQRERIHDHLLAACDSHPRRADFRGASASEHDCVSGDAELCDGVRDGRLRPGTGGDVC